MSYALSVDLGTTWSAAAIADEDGRVEVVSLGVRTASMPSVVCLRPDGTVLTGEAAQRRAVTEPARVAQEFKRRLGDPTPIVLGGTPYAAETLMAHLLRAVVEQAAETEGEPPETVVLSHPANYGPYKLDLLRQVARQADLDRVVLVTEPEAAAIHYSTLERIEPGEVVGVYDLGGGTFDAALVRRTDDGFELVGTPDGIDRFGGIDLDEAVLDHVRRSLGDAFTRADPDDPAVLNAYARLRDDCRAAKEALSTDTDAAIPVMLPGLHTEVRLTRAEFEDMIRPRLRDTVHTLERVVASAGMGWDDLARIVLVGGSSRIPLVSEVIRETTGRPVAVDAHTKHAIALGAAVATVSGDAVAPVPDPGVEEPAAAEPSPAPQPVAEPAAAEPAPAPQPVAEVQPGRPDERVEDDEAATPSESSGGASTRPRRRFPLVLAAGAGLVVIVAIVGLAVLFGNDGAGPQDGDTVLPTDGGQPSALGTPGPTDDGLIANLPPVEGPTPRSEVMALYLTGYQTPEGRGDWGAWSEAGTGPPEDLASDFYPLLGPYDSADPMVVGQHMAWLRQAGVGSIATPWSGTEPPEIAVLPLLLQLAEHYEVAVTPLLPVLEPDPAASVALLDAFVTEHGTSASLLRLSASRDPSQPLVVLLELGVDFELDVEAWSTFFTSAEGLGVRVIVDSADEGWLTAGAAGLVVRPGPEGYVLPAQLGEDRLYVPNVTPGLSTQRIGGPDEEDRQDGDTYRQAWMAALEPRAPAFVLIDSFNHWAIGNQIEPADDSFPSRDDTPYRSYGPQEPTFYLDLTGELVAGL